MGQCGCELLSSHREIRRYKSRPEHLRKREHHASSDTFLLWMHMPADYGYTFKRVRAIWREDNQHAYGEECLNQVCFDLTYH